jgi:hypothetical protein
MRELQLDCSAVRSRLPGYLDGALRSRQHAPVRVHLEGCADCREELERYQGLSHLMSRVEPVQPSPDLALQVRIAVSRARYAEPWLARVRTRFALLLGNVLEPIAVPATGGMLTSMFAFVLMLHNLFGGIPLGAVPNDVPMNLIQPARLETLTHLSMSNDDWLEESSGARVLVAEVVVNSRGEAVGYDILAGPDTPAVRRQLDQVILFSRFRPAMSFGRPIAGGRVVLNLTEIRVKG